MRISSKNALLLIASCAVSAGANAHDGHGLLGSHWHTSDTLGFMLLGSAIAALAWFIGRGK